MFFFHKKLSYIKTKLKEWNKVYFKNIFVEGQGIENKLKALNEVVIAKGMREEFSTKKKLKAEQAEILAREEAFWRQKLCELWLKDGDRNTKFFHNSAVTNRSKSRILELIRDDRTIVNSREGISQEAVGYFQSLLNRVSQTNNQ